MDATSGIAIGSLPDGWETSLPALFDEALPREALTLNRFVSQVLLDPNVGPQNLLCAQLDGRLAGFCLAIVREVPLEGEELDSDRGYITLFAVHPAYRGRGVADRLLDAAEAHFRERGCAKVLISPYSPGYFVPGVDAQAYPGALAMFSKRGYQEAGRPVAMQCDLWDMTIPEWVKERRHKLEAEGGRVEHWRPGLTQPLLAFAREEFGGDWVRWVRNGMAAICDGDSPDRLIIAHDAAGVLGFSHYKGERFGPIGVGAKQRGRGIGQVLMFETLQAQRRQGLRAAWFLWSDDATADRLYNTAGFHEVRRFVLLKKSL
jgi:ribosomal protein S18 acetylase RimI-like enzyme